MLPAKQAYFAVRTTIFSPATWTLKMIESWGKSKKDSNGEVDGLNWKWEGRPAPSVLSRPRSMYLWGFSQKNKQTNKQTNKQKTYNRYVVLC